MRTHYSWLLFLPALLIAGCSAPDNTVGTDMEQGAFGPKPQNAIGIIAEPKPQNYIVIVNDPEFQVNDP